MVVLPGLLAGGCDRRRDPATGPVADAPVVLVYEETAPFALGADWTCHDTLEGREAYYNLAENRGLLTPQDGGPWLLFYGWPEEWGGLGAIGWEGDAPSRMWLSVFDSSDSGRVIHIDVERRAVVRVDRWAAW
jgi:hypothetical protein